MSKKIFGLVGRNIAYSFSKTYFTEKFSKLPFQSNEYVNFDIQNIEQFPDLIKNNSSLRGLNVTIPYKQSIIPYLDFLSATAQKIGAVNVIRFTKKGHIKGYNSDWYGFKRALKPFLNKNHTHALILGTGGAAKAVAFALEHLGIQYVFVSREPTDATLSYDQLNKKVFEKYKIVINCTPLGTFPNVESFPPIPYHYFTPEHLAFDLIYNPEETLFLKNAKSRHAQTLNGMNMLIFQAEKAWEIWNK